MKQVIIITLLFISNFIFAQKKTATEKSMASACECMKKIDKKLNKDDLKKEMEKCASQAMLDNLQGLVEEYNVDLSDEKSAYEMGKKIGVKLTTNCPEFLELIANSDMINDKIDATEESSGTQFTEGTLKEIVIADVIYLTVEESNGDTRNFVLYNYFSGAQDFIKSPESYKNKQVKIGWLFQKVFDKKTNSFIERKIINALQLW